MAMSRLTGVVSVVILAAALCPVPAFADDTKVAAVQPSEETLRQGETMYRKGLLPSGQPMQALVRGDVTVDGTAFTCVSCHLRSGIGSIEGGVITPPTNGATLYRPLPTKYKGIEVPSAPPVRPAYTDESLANLLRTGVSPTGRRIRDVMPRYLINEQDTAALIAYLKTLSPALSPGYSDNTLRFATIVTDGVDKADEDAMLSVLDGFITSKNNLVKTYKERPKSARMAESMTLSKDAVYVKLALSHWRLKGSPDTWRAQLEDYNKKEPVFGLVGGITNGEWRPIHEFCEQNRIPCLLPITDFPVVSDSDWYTLYFSKGYYQEGEATARYMSAMEDEGRVLQLVRDSREGLALSEGFTKTWAEQFRKPAVTVKLAPDEKLTADSLRKMIEKERPSVLVVWDGPSAIPAVEGLAGMKGRPGAVMVSSVYMGKALYNLSDGAREFTYISYPYRTPDDEARLYKNFSDPFMKFAGTGPDEHRVAGRAVAIDRVLSQAVMDLRGNYYRDNLMDVIGMAQDQQFPVYERLSFGPSQRYASKGCYIIQLTKGDKPSIIKKSDWVSH